MKLAYTAYDNRGEAVAGTIDSPDVVAATEALRSKGLYVAQVVESVAIPEKAGKKLKLSKAEMALGVSAISRSALSVPSDDKLFRPKLERLLTTHSGTAKLPAPKKPLTDADGLAKVILTMQLRRDLRLPPDQVNAHPERSTSQAPCPPTPSA